MSSRSLFCISFAQSDLALQPNYAFKPTAEHELPLSCCAARGGGLTRRWRAMDEDSALEEARKRRAESTRWMLTFVIWAAGCVVLWGAWEWQKSVRGALGEIIAFALYIVMFFYFLALGPIRNWVCRFLGER